MSGKNPTKCIGDLFKRMNFSIIPGKGGFAIFIGWRKVR